MILQNSNKSLTTPDQNYESLSKQTYFLGGKMKKLFLVLFVLPSLMSAAPFQASPQTPQPVALAQQAYLEGDLSRAIQAAKSAYMQMGRNSVAQKNILQLAQQIQTMKLPVVMDVGWTLPSEIKDMRVSVARRLDDGAIRNKMTVGGSYKSVGEITNFQVIRYPDTVVLDKQKNIGHFEDSEDNGEAEYYYSSQSSPFMVTPGLYLLKISTKSGSTVDGWFFITDEDNSTANPQFVGFDGSPVFNSTTPQVSWQDFFSPQFRADRDYRMVSLWVGKQNEDSGKFNFWTSDMTTKSILLAAPVNPDHGWTRGPLTDGAYYVLLNYNEARRFGPIRIVRRSETVKYFSVKK